MYESVVVVVISAPTITNLRC